VENKGFLRVDLHQSREVGLIGRGINVLVLVIVEQSKKSVEPDVYAGRLNHRKIQGVQSYTARFEFFSDIPV
jgi:hypothetical protein